MKRALLVSQNFPPSTVASVHRCRHLAKHLLSFGWRPTVLTVDTHFHKEPPDPELSGLLPPDIEIIAVRAVPVRPLARIGIGDLSIRSFPFIRFRLAQLLNSVKYDIVLFTGWPFYHMLMTGWIRDQWGIPVILDFQDPWVSRAGADVSRWSKSGLAHRLAAELEPRAVRRADYITSVSQRQNDQMAERYPWLDRARMAAIPIGGDPEDFDALRAHPPERPSIRLDPALIHLSYVGTFLPRAGPLVRTVLRALAGVKRSHPELATRLRLNFVGTSNQPNGFGHYRVRPIAEEEGVGELVVETPQRIPFLDALNVLAQSQGLLLIGSDEPHYTASKIYPALMSGRPYLSLFHRASSAHAILAGAGGGVSFAFADEAELAAWTPALRDALLELALNPERFGRADPAAYAEYTAASVAGAFARVFEAVAKTGVG